MSDPTKRISAADSVLVRRAVQSVESDDDERAWAGLDLDDEQERQFGDYELLEKLGEGGMGVVFRARQASLAREVAIKFLRTVEDDGHAAARFQDEARSAAKLHHPGIVPVFEFGAVGSLHYFTMPLLIGRTLAEVIASSALSQRESVGFLAAACAAVGYAHSLGLLHLDLKPANILIDERGRPAVADFGLARMVNENGYAEAFELSGTPSFMSPEQARGEGARLTRAADVYALGGILYQLLTGSPPHGVGTTDRVIAAAIIGDVPPVRSLNRKVPADLAAICDRCLQFDPARRYADAASLEQDLARYLDGLPVAARPLGPLAQGWRIARRHRVLASVIVLLLVAIVAGSIVSTWQWRKAEAARVVAEARTAQMVELAKLLAKSHPSVALTPDGVCFGDIKRIEGMRFDGKMDCVSLKVPKP